MKNVLGDCFPDHASQPALFWRPWDTKEFRLSLCYSPDIYRFVEHFEGQDNPARELRWLHDFHRNNFGIGDRMRHLVAVLTQNFQITIRLLPQVSVGEVVNV